MKGKPKFKVGDVVKFESPEGTLTGTIYIVDAYGTFEDSSDVSYDILVSDQNCLYKHIKETFVVNE